MQAIIAILMQGVTVANPKAWQTGQVTGTVIGGLIIALINLAHVYGIALPVTIDPATANEAGAAILTLFNIGMSAASHEHIGIIPDDRK